METTKESAVARNGEQETIGGCKIIGGQINQSV